MGTDGSVGFGQAHRSLFGRLERQSLLAHTFWQRHGPASFPEIAMPGISACRVNTHLSDVRRELKEADARLMTGTGRIGDYSYPFTPEGARKIDLKARGLCTSPDVLEPSNPGSSALAVRTRQHGPC